MTVLIHLLTRSTGAPAAAFRQAWREMQGPLLMRLPGLRAYVQNHVVDRARMPLPDGADAAFGVDGIGQAWFDDDASLAVALASPEYRAACTLLPGFTRRGIAMVATRNCTLPFPGQEPGTDLPPFVRLAPPALKRMTLLGRDRTLERDAFHAWWRDQHVPVVFERQRAELRGYCQNYVHRGWAEHSGPGDAAAVICDGVTELILDDHAAMERLFPPTRVNGVTSHAAARIATMTSCLVEADRLA